MKKQIIILFMVLNSLIVFMPHTNIIDTVKGDPNTSGGNIVGDTVYWENSFANLSVYPHTSGNIIRQKQWANLTWKDNDNTIDVAFRFNDSLSYGKIWKWDGDSWNEVSMSHTTHAGKHYYYYAGFNVIQDTTYCFKWEYDVPANTSGKWHLFAKLSQHTIQQALENNWYVELDPWWDGSWGYYKTIEIESDFISGSLKNFPVLVNFTTAAVIDKCQDAGEDIRFVSTDNGTEFYYEIEKWTDGGASVWVNISEVIDEDIDYQFLMYYENDGAADGQSASDVWDGDYLGVYHLTELEGIPANDSTANENNGTYAGELPTRVTTKIGWGQDVEAVDADSWITFPDACWLTGTNFGMHEVFIRHESAVGIYMTQWNIAGTDRTYFSVSGDKYLTHGETGGGAVWDITDTGDNVPTNQWLNVILSMQEDNTKIIVDGYIIDTDTSCAMPDVDVSTKQTIRFGSQWDGSTNYFDGLVDEIRISDVVRNESWINASFYSQNQTPGFIAFGAEQEGVWANSNPINSAPDPEDNNRTLIITPQLRIQVNDTDIENQSINVTWSSDSSGSWVTFATNSSDIDATFYQTFTNATTPGTYNWRVSSNDGNGGSDIDTYTLTINAAPVLSGESPANYTVADIRTDISITMADLNGDDLDYTIEVDPQYTLSGLQVGDSSEFDVSPGTITLTINLSNNISYNWYVNCTDGYVWTNSSYNFTSRILYVNPPTGGSSHYHETAQYLNLSWTSSDGADENIVVQNNNSYPDHGVNGSGNWVRQNNSDDFFNLSWSETSGGYFSVYSWNSTADMYSYSYTILRGVDIPWGALTVNVYNESKSSEDVIFNIEISNSDSTEVYFAYNQSNTLYIDVNDIPFGDNTIFFITADGYLERTFYYDLALNNFYGYDFWLPPYITEADPGEGDPGAGDDGEGGNFTTTHLYRFRVVDDYVYPIANASVQIRRYMNATGQYENMSVLLTDGYGEADIYLVPGEHYRAFVTKTDFDRGIFDWIPDPVFYGANYPKIFQIIRITDTDTTYTFYDYIQFNATLHTNGSLFVNYIDHDSNTTDVQFYIYENYNFSTTFIESVSATSNTHSFWIDGVNNSREHEIFIYLNHTLLGFEATSIIVSPTDAAKYDEGEIERKISNAIGPFQLGYVATFFIYLPIMVFLVLPGPSHPGFAIILASLYGAFASSFIVVGSVLLIIPFAIAIGAVLMAVKGGIFKL